MGLNFRIAILLSVLFCSTALSPFVATGQNPVPAETNPATSTATESAVSNAPPSKNYSIKPNNAKFLSTDEYGLSLMVLIFGTVVLLFQFFLIWKKLFTPSQSVRTMIITLVIIASLFLISAGFSSDQITPIIGLLGTIVGYLLGSNQGGADKNDAL